MWRAPIVALLLAAAALALISCTAVHAADDSQSQSSHGGHAEAAPTHAEAPNQELDGRRQPACSWTSDMLQAVDCNIMCIGKPYSCCKVEDMLMYFDAMFMAAWNQPQHEPAAAACINGLVQIAGCTMCQPTNDTALAASNEEEPRPVFVSSAACDALVAGCGKLPRPAWHPWGAAAAAVPDQCRKLLASIHPQLLPATATDVAFSDWGLDEQPERCQGHADAAATVLQHTRQLQSNASSVSALTTGDAAADAAIAESQHMCPTCLLATPVPGNEGTESGQPRSTRRFVDVCGLPGGNISYTVAGIGTFVYDLDIAGTNSWGRSVAGCGPDAAVCYCTPEFDPPCHVIALRHTQRIQPIRTAGNRSVAVLEYTAPRCVDDPSRPWHTIVGIVCGSTPHVSYSENGITECNNQQGDFCTRCLVVAVPWWRCRADARAAQLYSGAPLAPSHLGPQVLFKPSQDVLLQPLSDVARFPRNGHNTGNGFGEVHANADGASTIAVVVDSCATDVTTVQILPAGSSMGNSPSIRRGSYEVVPNIKLNDAPDGLVTLSPAPPAAAIGSGWAASRSRTGVMVMAQFDVYMRCLTQGPAWVELDIHVGAMSLTHVRLAATCHDAAFAVVPIHDQNTSVQATNPVWFMLGGGVLMAVGLATWDKLCRARPAAGPAADAAVPTAATPGAADAAAALPTTRTRKRIGVDDKPVPGGGMDLGSPVHGDAAQV